MLSPKTECSSTDRPQAGFTLMEMIGVIAILAAMTALSLPYLQRVFRRNSLRSAASQIQTTLLAARMRAVRGNRATSIFVTTATAAGTTHLLHTISPDPPAPTPTPLPRAKLLLAKAELAFLTLPAGGKITFDGNGRVIAPAPPLSADILIEGPPGSIVKNQVTIRTTAAGKIEVVTPAVWQ